MESARKIYAVLSINLIREMSRNVLTDADHVRSRYRRPIVGLYTHWPQVSCESIEIHDLNQSQQIWTVDGQWLVVYYMGSWCCIAHSWSLFVAGLSRTDLHRQNIKRSVQN